jgi:uncharacterized protein YqhQ
MAEDEKFGLSVPQASYRKARQPRISGTALIGGLHLASGNYGTAPAWQLFISGLGIVAAMAVAIVLTYVELCVVDQFAGTSLAMHLFGFSAHLVSPWQQYVTLVLPLFQLLNFLVVLRMSPLSGYHAAEHKVVAAIEAYGDIQYEQVVEMPRAHPRCGTVLLFGVIPALLIAYPLFMANPVAAILIALIGWTFRYRVGYFIQQYFTTKPPTPGQLKAGMEAGRKLMKLWQADPDRQVSIARNMWIRGLPQMIAGVLLGQYLLLGIVYQNLHVWLDF